MGRRTISKIAEDDAALTAEIADLLADVPTLAECPLHGPDCEAWA